MIELPAGWARGIEVRDDGDLAGGAFGGRHFMSPGRDFP
jgi:hypothetical protein